MIFAQIADWEFPPGTFIIAALVIATVVFWYVAMKIASREDRNRTGDSAGSYPEESDRQG